MGIDYDFLPAYDLKPTAGRISQRNSRQTIKQSWLMKRAASLLGFANAADALGGKIRIGRDTSISSE